MSAKDRIREELAGGGSVSAGDFAGFVKPTPKEGEEEQPKKRKGAELEKDDVLEVAEEAKDAPAESVGNSGKAPINKISAGMQNIQDLFEFDLPDEITITAREKNIFLETIITGARFELPFSLFNGRLQGVFQSRTNRESDALISELQRRTIIGDITTDAEYTSAFRCAVLRFQLKSWGLGELEPVEEPLVQMRVFNDDSEMVLKDPVWYDEAVNMFGNQPDGIVSSIYKALLMFERKYWTMVKNAENQNFWNPEDSTSA